MQVSAIVSGIIAFLLAWAGKHVLDRLLLPRVLDWWARKNKKWAMERAAQLLGAIGKGVKVCIRYSTSDFVFRKSHCHNGNNSRNIECIGYYNYHRTS